MSSSQKASSKRRRPIHLLFIDASHRYKDVLLDFSLWSQFVPIGGIVAFHDYGGRFKGVTRVVDEEVILTNMWGDYHIYDRIFSATRIKT